MSEVPQRDGSLAIRRTRTMSTDGWYFSGDAVRFTERTAAAVRASLVCRNRVGSSTPELTDGAAFDERRVLGPRLTGIFAIRLPDATI